MLSHHLMQDGAWRVSWLVGWRTAGTLLVGLGRHRPRARARSVPRPTVRIRREFLPGLCLAAWRPPLWAWRPPRVAHFRKMGAQTSEASINASIAGSLSGSVPTAQIRDRFVCHIEPKWTEASVLAGVQEGRRAQLGDSPGARRLCEFAKWRGKAGMGALTDTHRVRFTPPESPSSPLPTSRPPTPARSRSSTQSPPTFLGGIPRPRRDP
jgi:hypothetical protein